MSDHNVCIFMTKPNLMCGTQCGDNYRVCIPHRSVKCTCGRPAERYCGRPTVDGYCQEPFCSMCKDRSYVVRKHNIEQHWNTIPV